MVVVVAGVVVVSVGVVVGAGVVVVGVVGVVSVVVGALVEDGDDAGVDVEESCGLLFVVGAGGAGAVVGVVAVPPAPLPGEEPVVVGGVYVGVVGSDIGGPTESVTVGTFAYGSTTGVDVFDVVGATCVCESLTTGTT